MMADALESRLFEYWPECGGPSLLYHISSVFHLFSGQFHCDKLGWGWGWGYIHMRSVSVGEAFIIIIIFTCMADENQGV